MVTKEQLTQRLYELRTAVSSKRFHEAEELFKEIESVKVQIAALSKKS